MNAINKTYFRTLLHKLKEDYEVRVIPMPDKGKSKSSSTAKGKAQAASKNKKTSSTTQKKGSKKK